MFTLHFDNAFVRELPGDPEPGPRLRQVEGALYSRVEPTPVAAPQPAGVFGARWRRRWASSEADVAAPEFAAGVWRQCACCEGMQPYAANYGGHQFGNWAGQLGDGRAISLGEVVNAAGERWELQLKGAGPTPYSRGADGRAVLRSSIREFLCSEAMHHLGVPTTRALSLVGTGEPVVRDMFYDGHAALGAGRDRLPGGAVVHPLRQLRAAGLARRHRAAAAAGRFHHPARFSRTAAGTGEALYAAWFAEVCERTADMIAHWMRVGFVHGVMNTDNMSILGLTIDYGPYGWIDNYDPDWTPNTTDAQRRRYRFGQQPQRGVVEPEPAGRALAPLFAGVEPLQAGLDRYAARLRRGRSRQHRGASSAWPSAATTTWR